MSRVRCLISGACLAGMLVLSSCAASPGTPGWLAGTWKTNPPAFGPITFNADGTAKMNSPRGEDLKLTWTLSGTTLSMTQNGETLPDATLSEIEEGSFTGDRPSRPPVQFTRDADWPGDN